MVATVGVWPYGPLPGAGAVYCSRDDMLLLCGVEMWYWRGVVEEVVVAVVEAVG